MTRLLFISVAFVTTSAVIWGILTVGGPAHARIEKNDLQRFADLRQLADFYRCKPYDRESQISPLVSGRCANRPPTPPDVVDPTTGAAYEAIFAGETAFEVCAVFQAAKGVNAVESRAGIYFHEYAAYIFEGHKGCLGYERDTAQSLWTPRAKT